MSMLQNHGPYFEQDMDVGSGGAPGVSTVSPDPAPSVAPVDPSSFPVADTVAPTPAPQSDWPDDWRDKVSKDPELRKTLDRFASPKAVFESYQSLRQKMSSGELKSNTPFPEKGTPEEILAWRAANGVPERPEDYNLKFPNGLVFGDDDKPFVEDFLKMAHSRNIPADKVNGVLQWYQQNQEKLQDERETRDIQYLKEAEDHLRTEWGGEYRRNINLIKGLVDTLPESVKPLFHGARLADGSVLLNHPDMARWLVATARTINPMATVIPGVSGASMASAIEDEISSIEKVMRTDRSAYNKNEKMQARLRELYGARSRAK